MKQKKSGAAKRPSKISTQRRTIRTGRALHKRVLLHPFTVMVLLCAGVLITGTTIRSFAVSYDVTATVPAPLPGSPAVITSPTDQQHFSTTPIAVTGTCPPQSYVKLSRNGAFSGVSQCVNQSFQIQTDLSLGANQLAAQVYSLTDQAGPAGASIAAYYDQTTVTQPSAPSTVPTTMWVADVEGSGLKDSLVSRTSDNPTIAGWAPPWSTLTITFHSTPQVCTTQADGLGWWTCTLDHTLPAGLHHVDVTAVSTTGQKFTFPTFQINVISAQPSALRQQPTTAVSQPVIRADYQYRVSLGLQATGLDLALAGGTAPYTVATDWGDGTTTTLARSDTLPFTLSHTYAMPSGVNKDYTVLVRATDANGLSTFVQLSVVVKGTSIVLLASNNTLNQFLNSIHRWLWLIWPTYIVVVLMAIGYYLGEREEYQHLMAKRRAHSAGKLK
jgi:hypothetical protein